MEDALEHGGPSAWWDPNQEAGENQKGKEFSTPRALGLRALLSAWRVNPISHTSAAKCANCCEGPGPYIIAVAHVQGGVFPETTVKTHKDAKQARWGCAQLCSPLPDRTASGR